MRTYWSCQVFARHNINCPLTRLRVVSSSNSISPVHPDFSDLFLWLIYDWALRKINEMHIQIGHIQDCKIDLNIRSSSTHYLHGFDWRSCFSNYAIQLICIQSLELQNDNQSAQNGSFVKLLIVGRYGRVYSIKLYLKVARKTRTRIHRDNRGGILNTLWTLF